MIRSAIYRGSDVRLTSGVLMNPASWPRQSFDTSLLKWKIVLAFPQSGQHINALELRAALAAQKWMRRASRNIHCRFIHCLDSQVCIAVATKGRSSSYLLNSLLIRLNANVLASSQYPFYTYVRSETNPADKPSRWHTQRKSQK